MIITRRNRIAEILIFALVVTIILEIPQNAIIARATTDHNLSKPIVTSEVVAKWDCVYFGRYWQNDTNGDGVVDKKDDKEPVKWRILSKNQNDIFLIADQNLDCKPYNYLKNEEIDDDWDDWDLNEDIDDDWNNVLQVSVTWETSTLRSWLNGYENDKNMEGINYSNDNFIDEVFTEDEQKVIKETDVVNENNPYYDTVAGNNTKDKIYLLSIAEISSTEYGLGSVFKTSSDNDVTVFINSCKAENSRYAMAQGAYDVCSSWWLRSPGKSNAEAAVIDTSGMGLYDGYDVDWNYGIGVRPVLHLDANANGLYFDAGTVSVEEMESTWDCIYFGHYRQNDTNKDGVINERDEKEPIKWRILSINGDDAFILSDKSLDAQEYDNSENNNITWETCTLRSWLNGTFYEKAFSTEEQSAINTTLVENKKNPKYGTSGGENTSDNIFLLSLEEVTNSSFGFSSDFKNSSDTRKAKDTEYTKAHVMYGGEEENWGGFWWLRSPGDSSECAMDVSFDGSVSLIGGSIWKVPDAVRPALHINLAAVTWSKADSVTAKEGGQSSEGPQVSSKPETTQKPEESSGNETPNPTSRPVTTESPKPTHNPNITESPRPTDGLSIAGPVAGTVLMDDKNKVSYKVIEQGKAVAFYKLNNKKETEAIVPSDVTISGIKYKVTAISDNAFNGCKKLKLITIGKNVTAIGNKAFFKCTLLDKITIPTSVVRIGKKVFYGCKKLKSIVIKSNKLKSKSVGVQAFKGIHKKAVIKVPKKKIKTYKKWLKKKGIGKSVKIK